MVLKSGFNKLKDWVDLLKPEVREVRKQLKEAQSDLENKKYGSAADTARGVIERLHYAGVNREDSGYHQKANQILSDARRKAA